MIYVGGHPLVLMKTDKISVTVKKSSRVVRTMRGTQRESFGGFSLMYDIKGLFTEVGDLEFITRLRADYVGGDLKVYFLTPFYAEYKAPGEYKNVFGGEMLYVGSKVALFNIDGSFIDTANVTSSSTLDYSGAFHRMVKLELVYLDTVSSSPKGYLGSISVKGTAVYRMDSLGVYDSAFFSDNVTFGGDVSVSGNIIRSNESISGLSESRSFSDVSNKSIELSVDLDLSDRVRVGKLFGAIGAFDGQKTAVLLPTKRAKFQVYNSAVQGTSFLDIKIVDGLPLSDYAPQKISYNGYILDVSSATLTSNFVRLTMSSVTPVAIEKGAILGEVLQTYLANGAVEVTFEPSKITATFNLEANSQ